MNSDYGENEHVAKKVGDGVCRLGVGDVLATESDRRWSTAH